MYVGKAMAKTLVLPHKIDTQHFVQLSGSVVNVDLDQVELALVSLAVPCSIHSFLPCGKSPTDLVHTCDLGERPTHIEVVFVSCVFNRRSDDAVSTRSNSELREKCKSSFSLPPTHLDI